MVETPLQIGNASYCERCRRWISTERYLTHACNEATPVKDNWSNRSATMRCITCVFYVPKVDEPLYGRCRRHAPTLGGWPAMRQDDWCGDHKIDGSKIP